MIPFRNRADAGRRLASMLQPYAHRDDVIVLGLPRGGVPVAYEVARELQAPLDVFIVRKLGVPGSRELAMGAIATGGVQVLNESVVRGLRISDEVIDYVTDQESQELARLENQFRNGRPAPNLDGRTVILVDDGLATGATMYAAIRAVRQLNPARIVVAVPVASPDICDDLRSEVGEIVCAATPEPFIAVGFWYRDFSQTTDEEVRDLLERANSPESAAVAGYPSN